jgi:hypothetical protein
MSSPPGRRTKAAESDRRSSWYGLGTYTNAEKDSFGRFLDDVVFTFADVSVFGILALGAVAASLDTRGVGLQATALFAWVTMSLLAALLRGGWIRPLGTRVRGWVAWTPSMVLLRLVYYNATLALATLGGVGLANLSGVPAMAGTTAVVVAGLATASFPKTAELVARQVARYWPTGVPGEYRL